MIREEDSVVSEALDDLCPPNHGLWRDARAEVRRLTPIFTATPLLKR